ncbi:capsular biosynthesis protein [Enterovirga aerilata]|uniref:Capsular biosynthesis protein n=1 Tax=Enterovirga aerilata TaxID=2730920 RepID=A0A849I754_9HYPH|nr:capsular biosynthesis protein [Enterovirga sp. DB1703]NNM73574.1 capsular biosynthesis protein [Enterovirga sp. DB1703]
MNERLGILSRDLWALRDDISGLLGCEIVWAPAAIGRLDGVLGWAGGTGMLARRFATLARVPFRPVSTGPLRSVRPRPDSPPLSLVVAGRPPRVSRVGPAEGLAALRRLRLSWRNDGRDRLPFDPAGRGLVLVGAGSARDRALLRRAALDNPGSRLAVMADARRPAALAATVARAHAGALAVAGVSPWALLDAARRVYAPPGGELAVLARLAGRELDGLSDGGTAEAVFARHFLDEPVYLDAWTRRETDFLTAADQLAWQRDRFRENDRRSYCVGVSRWKAGQVARFLDGPDGPAVKVRSDRAAVRRAVAAGGRIVAWETRMPARLEAAAAEAGLPLLRMEDGFLRSVGLGAAFLPGASCVLDSRGIYYDPRRESDLEHILATAEFGPDVLARAAALRREVVALRLSKYNVGRHASLDDFPAGGQVVLVPGQVEDDASVLLGSPRTPGNLALLRAARARNPGAFIVFKPHPDVEAGLRRGRLSPAQMAEFADRVVRDVAIVDLLDRVDAVETMTSLAGFEALLRGRRTVVHGRPFYAGWGLTEDLDPPPRRTRRLALDELVAGALILYPRYVDPATGQRCPPEVLVRRLAEARDAAQHKPAARAAARAAYVRARHALLTPIGRLLRQMKGAVRNPARPE